MPIYQRKDSKNGIWWISFTDPNGRRIRQSSGTTDKQRAQQLHDTLKAESWRINKLGEKPRYTWQQAVLKYLSYRCDQKSLRTTKEVLRYLDKHLRDKYLDEINKTVIDQIRQHKRETGVKPGTVNRTLTVLRAVLNTAHEAELIENVPVVKLLPDKTKRIRVITQKQAEELFKRLPPHLAAMARFALATGLRHSNVTGLKWEQIDLKRGCAWIHADEAKGEKAIYVPLNSEALTVIRSQIGKHLTYVFTYKNRPIKTANTKAFRKTLKQAGIENFNWHGFRHSWASRHIQNGTPLPVLKELGGWADMKMVMRYVHFNNKLIKKYAENANFNDTNLTQSEKQQLTNIS